MQGLNTLNVTEIVSGVRAGRFSAADVLESCLDRIEARNGGLKAWAHVDATAARKQALVLSPSLPLAGVPFGAKDVLDSAQMPTEMGSSAYGGHRPRYDAACVAQMRMAGAILVGKTVSAEFAGTSPTDTVNPHNPKHTPGGSSSGSAAAVADFMVPFALGTQTGGSVLRPATFCGVVGFKPTYGFYSIAGMKPAAHSFDTIGLIARSVNDIALLHSVFMNEDGPGIWEGTPRIGVFRSHLWDTVGADMQAAFALALSALAKAGAKISEYETPSGFDSITQQRAIVNAFERARGLASEWLEARDQFTPQMRETCTRGFLVKGEDYVAARQAIETFQWGIATLFSNADILITPAVPGSAPEGHAYAGDPRLQELWTMLHLPSLSLPFQRSANGLPLGIQFVGPRFGDTRFLAATEWVSDALKKVG